MLLSDVTSMVPTLYATRKTVSLEGAPGMGKTQVVRTWPEILSKHFGVEFGYWEDNPATRDFSEYAGLQFPIKGEDGKPAGFYTRPASAPPPSYLEQHPYGIYFMDEFAQADEFTHKALSRFVLEKWMGNVHFPEGWWVVLASNGTSHRAGAHALLSFITNRITRIQVTPDAIGWGKWAQANDIHPMYYTFAMRMPGQVFSGQVPKEDVPFCTPRSLVDAHNHHMEVMEKDADGRFSMALPTEGPIVEIIEGDIGSGAASTLCSFLRQHEFMPTLEEVIKDPLTAKCPGLERLDAAYAIAQMLVHYVDRKNIEQFFTYLERLPKELITSTAKRMLDKAGSALLNSRKLNEWLARNKVLVNATMA